MRLHILFRTILPSTSTAVLGLAAALGHCSLSSAAVHVVEENLSSGASEIIADFKPDDKNSKGGDRAMQGDRDKRDNGKHKSKGKHKKHGPKKHAEMKKPKI